MAKSYGQFDQGAGQKYAKKRGQKKRTRKVAAAREVRPGTGNAIRDANQIRQDMARHRRRVMRMGA